MDVSWLCLPLGSSVLYCLLYILFCIYYLDLFSNPPLVCHLLPPGINGVANDSDYHHKNSSFYIIFFGVLQIHLANSWSIYYINNNNNNIIINIHFTMYINIIVSPQGLFGNHEFSILNNCSSSLSWISLHLSGEIKAGQSLLRTCSNSRCSSISNA